MRNFFNLWLSSLHILVLENIERLYAGAKVTIPNAEKKVGPEARTSNTTTLDMKVKIKREKEMLINIARVFYSNYLLQGTPLNWNRVFLLIHL